MKRREIGTVVLAAFLVVLGFLVNQQLSQSTKSFLSHSGLGSGKSGPRYALEDEAVKLERAGRNDEALEKYRQAINPVYMEFDWQSSMGRGGIIQILTKQGKYEEALKEFEWFMKANPEKFSPWKKELESLLDFQKNGNAQIIYDYIEYYKREEKISPSDYGDAYSIGTILRLYNHIGDHDAGIRMIDECMEYFKKRDIEKYGEYRPGHGDEEYLKIREGFERDKAEGFKGCAGAKPGEVCMGHATRALVESKYFPW